MKENFNMMKKYIVFFLLFISSLNAQDNIELLFIVKNRYVSNFGTNYLSYTGGIGTNPSGGFSGGLIYLTAIDNYLEQYQKVTIDRNNLPSQITFNSYNDFAVWDSVQNGYVDAYCNVTYKSRYNVSVVDSFYQGLEDMFEVTYDAPYMSNSNLDTGGCQEGSKIAIMTPTQSQILQKGNCDYFRIPEVYDLVTTTPRTPGLVNKIEYQTSAGGAWSEFIPVIYNPYSDGHQYFKLSDLPVGADYTGVFNYRVKIVNTKYLGNPGTVDADYIETSAIQTEVKQCPPKIITQTVQANNNCFDGSTGSVYFKFDRALRNNEYLNITYTNSISGPGNVLNITSLNANNEYLLSNLPIGTYTNVKIQSVIGGVDAGIVTANDFTITSPPKITFTKTSTNVLCNGAATGSITVTATGGVPPYSYSKDNGATWQTSNVLSGLPAATYLVQVKDSNGCIAPDGNQPVNITQPASAVAIQLVAEVNPSTDIATDGSIDVTVTGGVSPYTYNWTSSTNNIAGQSTNEDLANLGGTATYTLTVTDANGCTAILTRTLTAPAPIEITFNNPQLLCNGDVANLVATITGGNLPYDYQNFIWIPSGVTPVNTTNTSTLNGVGQGTYTITIKDARNVFKSATHTIAAAPSAISIVGINTTIIGGVSSIEQKCFGDNATTLIDVNVTGGTGSYTYSWYNLANPTVVIGLTQDLTNVAPGSYKLEVKDANNCLVSKNFNVIPASQISFTASVTGVIVNPGTATGAITVSASGGTGTYQYSLNGTTWQSSNVFNNLVAGTYTVYVKDANDCIVGPQTILITEPTAFTIGITLLNSISCFGGNDGSLKAIATGGTPPYTYTWSDTNGNNYTGETISNLPEGIYTVTVTDSNGVTRTSPSYSLVQPIQLAGSTTKTDVKCNGENNGSITFTASGGTAPYKYYVNGTLYTVATVTGLAPGTYTCEIKDDKNCSLSLPNVIINEPAILNVTGAIYPVTNATATDGSITLTVTGGTPPYTYSWASNLSNTTNVLSNLGVGTYNVTVTDANGCSVTQSYTVTTIQPLTVNLNTANSITAINCYGDTNGKLEAIASGGRPSLTVPSYLYEWRNGLNIVIGTSASITGLAAGTYTVYVTDFNTPPSTIQQSFTITQPASPLTATLQITNPILCAGGTGSLSVSPNGGTPTYTYEWRNSANIVVGTTSIVNSLVAETYTCKVTDANGCSLTQTITLTSPNALNATYSQVNVLINGQSTGSITVNATGGTGAYTYIINNLTTQTTNVFANLAAGNYIVEVKDANGCSVTLNVTITESPVLQVVINQPVANQILCYGGNTGALTTTVSGGVAPYYYQWKKDGVVLTGIITSSINTLAAGLYEVEVRDNVGAIQTQTFTIIEPTQLAVSFVTNPVTCTATNSGSITATVTGGTPPYTFSWNTGYTGTNNSSSDTFHILSNIPIGTYSVSITDSNGCTLTPPSVTVGTSTGLNLGATVVDVTCGNVNNGSITINPTGGTGSYSIVWTNPAYTGFVLTNLAAGTYTGTLIDGICTLPFSLSVQGTTPLTVNLGTDLILCAGQSHSIDATITSQTVTYAWTATNGFTSTSPIVTLTDGGTYTLTVTTSNGCDYSDSILITKLGDAIEAKCMVASQTFKDQEIVLVNISDRNSTNTYQWISPTQAQIVSQNDDVLILKFTQAGKYDVGLKSINTSGCQIIDSKVILVEEGGSDNTIDTSNIFIKDFKIFPNPISSVVNDFNVLVTLAYEMPVTLSIYKVEQGVLINEVNLPAAKVHNKQFSLSLASGVYYVVLKTPGSVQAKKIIKN